MITGVGGNTVVNNTITGNKAIPPDRGGTIVTEGFGGGIYTGKNTYPTIEKNVIKHRVQLT